MNGLYGNIDALRSIELSIYTGSLNDAKDVCRCSLCDMVITRLDDFEQVNESCVCCECIDCEAYESDCDNKQALNNLIDRFRLQ